MKIAYFDCFAGISGDMTVGALIDLGIDHEWIENELRKLPLRGYQLKLERVQKGGIAANQFSVILEDEHGRQATDSEFVEVDLQSEQTSMHQEFSEHYSHNHGSHHAHPHRGLNEILGMIGSSQLSEKVKKIASLIFTRLGEAESQVHGVDLQQVHFHEVGGVDAIIDIVGAAIALERLGVEAIYASSLHLGSGFVQTQHGLLPVPAPATARLLEGIPAYSTQVRGELVTPTGAAIVATLAEGFGPQPLMTVQGVGYGAGKREREFPNVLRIFLGETSTEGGQEKQNALSQNLDVKSFLSIKADVRSGRGQRDPHPEQHLAPVGPAGYHESPGMVLEATIDDMEPELFEAVMEKLLQAGALDVYLVPVQMKKSRPGIVLHILAHPDSVEELLEIVFSESTSIGVRTYPVTKRMLQRQMERVETPFGTVNVKISRLGDRIVNVKPEYEDCRALAIELNRPIKDVLAAARQAAWQIVENG